MRLGCSGCLVLSLLGASLVAAGVVGVMLSSAVFAIPEGAGTPDYTAEDGRAGQQKLAEILLRERGLSRAKGQIIITQPELNGFLANHLDTSERVPMNPLIVRLSPGIVEIQGRTAFSRLLVAPPFSLLAEYLPRGYASRSVWVTAKGWVKHDRSKGSLEIVDVSVGTQPISPWVLSWMLGRKGQQLFHWQVPGSVDRITIEDGRVVVTTRRSAASGGSGLSAG